MNEKDCVLTVLREALPELRRQWPIRSLALFGSIVRKDASPKSDLDVLVEFEHPSGSLRSWDWRRRSAGLQVGG
jgi:predicted nucleotidyltransferase